jgi:hypothetical protein
MKPVTLVRMVVARNSAVQRDQRNRDVQQREIIN